MLTCRSTEKDTAIELCFMTHNLQAVLATVEWRRAHPFCCWSTMRNEMLVLSILSWALAFPEVASAFSVRKDELVTASPHEKSTISRRNAFVQVASSTSASLLLSSPWWTTPPPAFAVGNDWTTFNDSKNGFSIAVPSTWSQTEQELFDRRKIVVWTDPTDAATAIFIAYTPVRDDFTSLGSFGTVDQVAAQTILPKGKLMDEDSENESKLISAISAKQAYIFDYVQKIGNTQPETHYRTIFALQQGATGGAGAVLVTISLQTPEARYTSVKPLFDKMIDSYGKSA